jgi:hypothetical protein
MTPDEIQQIEIGLEDAKKAVKFGQALERLTNNKDFKAVILEGLFRDEAVRLVHLKSHPAMQTEEHQKNILREMDGIGSLVSYLRNQRHFAAQMEKQLNDCQEALNEGLTEEADV